MLFIFFANFFLVCLVIFVHFFLKSAKMCKSRETPSPPGTMQPNQTGSHATLLALLDPAFRGVRVALRGF